MSLQKRNNVYKVVRRSVNSLATVILLFAIYYGWRRHWPAAIGFGIYGVGLFTPRYLYQRSHWWQKVFNQGMLTTMELLLGTALIVSSLGYVWLFNEAKWFNFDSYAHFIIVFMLTLLLAIILTIWQHKKNKVRDKKTLIMQTIILVMVGMFAWELFEFIVSTILQIDFYGQIGQPLDTWYDILAGMASLPISGLLIYKYHDIWLKHWLA
ncbi:MAG: hypothetical protein ACKKL5_01245 [Candidatus Komeilibacteria bacterium]